MARGIDVHFWHVARLALLLPLLFYLTYEPQYARRPVSWAQMMLFFAVLLALPLVGRALANRIARIDSETVLHRASVRLNRLLGMARMAALLWTSAGLYVFGYGDWVSHVVSRFAQPSLAGAVLATLPAYGTWLLLYWAQYPAERTLREQAILIHLEAAFPVRAPPTLVEYLVYQLRTGPGVILLPVLAVLLLRDVTHLGLKLAGVAPNVYVESALYTVSALAVFVLSPVLVTRVLQTRSLPPGELRDRLSRLAGRANVKFRDVLLWDTGNAACNALVAGIVHRFRYVMLSDLLIESLPDEAIEAVFAHELGHIVHRHIAWYGVFLFSSLVVLGWVAVPIEWMARRAPFAIYPDVITGVVSLGAAMLAFGALSRLFERQADVFAARAMQSHPEAAGEPAGVDQGGRTPSQPLAVPVGVRGASAFSNALRRVAYVNNMPLEAWTFTHGSIAGRIRSVESLAADPTLTPRFDVSMRRTRAVVVVIMLAAAATLALH